MKKTCWCGLIASLLIIVFTWLWMPSWSKIAVTVLAVILALISLFGCCCKGSCAKSENLPPKSTI